MSEQPRLQASSASAADGGSASSQWKMAHLPFGLQITIWALRVRVAQDKGLACPGLLLSAFRRLGWTQGVAYLDGLMMTLDESWPHNFQVKPLHCAQLTDDECVVVRAMALLAVGIPEWVQDDLERFLGMEQADKALAALVRYSRGLSRTGVPLSVQAIPALPHICRAPAPRQCQ